MKNILSLLFLFLCCGCHREPPEPKGPLFDVPLLFGKTQGEINQQLGVMEVPNIWEKNGTKLTAQYSQSGLLTGFLLESDEPLKDEKRDVFLKRSNLKQDDSRYQVSFVEAPDKVFYFTGAQIQLPTTHEVELRVEGPEVLVNVNANGEEFTTIPPWKNDDKKLQASVGQQISLSVSLFPTKGTPPGEPLKLQIIVDGRVVKEVSKAYEARCELTL